MTTRSLRLCPICGSPQSDCLSHYSAKLTGSGEPPHDQERLAKAEISAAPSERRGARLLAGALAVAVMSAFLIFIHNRYLPIHEGWFSYYGYLMRQGKMPYRDFYFFGQPVSLFISKLFVGDHLINLRRFGLIERIVLTGMLYFLLSRKFSPLASFWATVTSLMLFGTYISDALFTYLVDSLVALVGGMICVYQAYAYSKYERLLFFLAGIFTSLSFFSKQTTGFLASVAIALLIVWLGSEVPRITRSLAFYSAGWLIAAAPIIWWLVANGAWQPYLTEAYKGAVASKGGGSMGSALFGFLERSLSPTALIILVILVLLAVHAMRREIVRSRNPDEPQIKTTEIVWATVIALTAISLPVLFRVDAVAVFIMRATVLLLSRLIFYVMLVAMTWVVVSRLRFKTLPRDRVTIIFLVGGTFWAFGSAMSHMVEQHSVILGVALLIATVYDTPGWRVQSAHRRRVSAVCVLLLATSALMKYNVAFDWHGWRCSVTLSPVRSHWPQLADYQIDKATVEAYDTIIDDVVRYSKPGEPIFTFMSMPMFNWITGRPQPTFCPVHYFDVCPDDVSEADAQRVETARPAVLVVMWMPEKLWRNQEEAFRKGRRSGQRAIQKVIDDLTSSGDYTLVDSIRCSPYYPTTINVWARVGENQFGAKRSDESRK